MSTHGRDTTPSSTAGYLPGDLPRPAASHRGAALRDAEVRAAAALAEHGPREGEALDAYERVLESCDDPGIRYLIGMILDDERRHHRQITEMLHQLQSFLWEVDVEPQLPHLRPLHDPELRAATEKLLAVERDDADELVRLRRELRGQPRSTMLPLMVELMIHDTAKHIEILTLIRSHVH